ncbi:MAG: hypothetical protein GX883_01910 [Firmicutes bacterium]|nr:hypothetical protein [Bacillota bacterium]
MEIAKMRPADLNKEALQILQEAEASINRCAGVQGEPPAEIILLALNGGK